MMGQDDAYKMRSKRVQAALEYLLTYGWALLILAVVILILFEVGAFDVSPLPLVCLGSPQFLCSNPTLSSSGALTIRIGYTGSTPVTITGLACNVTPSSKPPSVETTDIALTSGQTVYLTFLCPLLNTQVGTTSGFEIWFYYNELSQTNLQEKYARGILKVSYSSTFWNVTEWTPKSTNVNVPPYGWVAANPAQPNNITAISTGSWSSLIQNNSEGYSYSTDYHNHDVYFGIETTLFPMKLLSADNASCSKPYSSHGYTATATVHLNGIYTFTTITDDGTEIFYRQVGTNPWTSIFGGTAWIDQPPKQYGPVPISFPAGDYQIAIDYIDSCDPAGLSAISITPPM